MQPYKTYPSQLYSPILSNLEQIHIQFKTSKLQAIFSKHVQVPKQYQSMVKHVQTNFNHLHPQHRAPDPCDPSNPDHGSYVFGKLHTCSKLPHDLQPQIQRFPALRETRRTLSFEQKKMRAPVTTGIAQVAALVHWSKKHPRPSQLIFIDLHLQSSGLLWL